MFIQWPHPLVDFQPPSKRLHKSNRHTGVEIWTSLEPQHPQVFTDLSSCRLSDTVPPKRHQRVATFLSVPLHFSIYGWESQQHSKARRPQRLSEESFPLRVRDANPVPEPARSVAMLSASCISARGTSKRVGSRTTRPTGSLSPNLLRFLSS